VGARLAERRDQQPRRAVVRRVHRPRPDQGADDDPRQSRRLHHGGQQDEGGTAFDAEGEGELVVTVRRKFQSTMRDDLVGGVELLTGRKVVSFLSDHDVGADTAAEVFVLDGAPRLPEVPTDVGGAPPAA
jgi:hypothetical protein